MKGISHARSASPEAKVETRSDAVPDLRSLLVAERLSKRLQEDFGINHVSVLGMFAHTSEYMLGYPASSSYRSYRRSATDEIRELKRQIDAMKKSLSACPSVEILQKSAETFNSAISTTPNEEAARVAIAWLLDSKVKQAANPETYFETLVYDVIDEGFSPAIIAAACQRARRQLKFLPEISEIVKICSSVKKEYSMLSSYLNEVAERRPRYEEDFSYYCDRLSELMRDNPDALEDF